MQKPRAGNASGYSNGINRDIEMKTKETAAALAVFSSRTATQRDCGGRSNE